MVSPKKDRKEKTENGEKPSEAAKSNETPQFRYGPMPKISNHRIWSRGIVIIGVIIYVWYTSKAKPEEIVLAKSEDLIHSRAQNVDCDQKYLDEVRKYPQCAPKQCGRFVSDRVATEYDAENLIRLAKKVIGLGGGSGGASIFDLHTGALSHGEQFVNAYKLNEAREWLTSDELQIYSIIKTSIARAIAKHFNIDINFLYLTHPTFISKLSNKEPKIANDEYWHVHVDKETYGGFHYTALLYLNTYNKDYKGGRFVFVDTNGKNNVTVEPRKGRVSIFTSGAENPHFVERVTEGERYAITISFTCNRNHAIVDPSTQELRLQ